MAVDTPHRRMRLCTREFVIERSVIQKIFVNSVEAWPAMNHLSFHPCEICEQTNWSTGFCAGELAKKCRTSLHVTYAVQSS